MKAVMMIKLSFLLLFGVGAMSSCINDMIMVDGQCPEGTRVNPDGLTCTDIDECAEGISGCSHTCNNFCKGYSCSCPSEYILDEDNLSCVKPPEDCEGYWTDFGECSTTCGCGLQQKEFIVTNHAKYGGKECEATDGYLQAKPCQNAPCPVEFEVSDWEDGPCSSTCGDDAFRTRTRHITQKANYPGAMMPKLTEVVQCEEVPLCPVDCVTSDWAISQCSEICGPGVETHTREILQPQVGDGAACGELEKSIPCMLKTCPINLKLWRNMTCSGTALSMENSTFGIGLQSEPSCRVLSGESTTGILSECAAVCDGSNECDAFVWYEQESMCCFKGNITSRILSDGANCFEALSAEAKLRAIERMERALADESTWTVTGIVTMLTGILAIAVAAVLGPAMLGASKPTISSAPPASSEGIRSPNPQADPMTPMPAFR